MTESVRRQLDVLEAQLELVKAMLAALRASLVVPQAATIALPTHCDGVPESVCALRNEDARIDKASLTNPNAWVCRGCSVFSSNGLTT